MEDEILGLKAVFQPQARVFPFGCGSKIGTQSETLVNGKDQTCGPQVV